MNPDTAAALLPVLVVLPLAAAILLALARRGGAAVSILVSATVLLLVAGLTAALGSPTPIQLELAGWAPPVGIALRLDGWAAAFLAMTALVITAVSWYAAASAQTHGTSGFWTILLLLLAGLNSVYLSADLFNTYVALELVTVAAIGLIALGGPSSYGAALRYLFVAVLGSLLFLMAVTVVYAQTGTLHLDHAAARGLPAVATVLATLGMAVKTALVPLHAWLPPAHAGAPSAVSPLMSALVIKAAFYVLLRWWAAGPADTLSAELALTLGVLGGVAIVWGSLLALRQGRLKRVVAYSTVAQVGYFFLLFPFLAASGPAARSAVTGVLVLALGHGLAKASMFMATGALLHAHGTDELVALRGAASRSAVATFAFGISGVALAGLPPTLAFVGKWQLLQASLLSGGWGWLVLVVLGGLLTFAYVGRVLAVLLGEPDHPKDEPPQPLLRVSATPALVLALLTVALTLAGGPLVELLAMDTPAPGASP